MAGMQNEGEIAACNYHAGMTPKQRIQVQNQWRTGALQVVVATIAFGMGKSYQSFPHALVSIQSDSPPCQREREGCLCPALANPLACHA